jgi:methionyl-tRNA formyltransferase
MPSIIFMGTPEFAVPTLDALIEKKYDIRLVVTQPDRPSGRGQKLQPPPIKTLAIERKLEVLQPESLRKDSSAVEKILNTPCDFLVVIAFGQILPKNILEHPSVAPLNVHASLLPAYRGAAPIARAIIEGEEKSGVTIQWMIEALDQGDILYQLPCSIGEEDTAGTLHDRLKELGARALVDTLQLFEKKQIVRRSQDARVGSYAPKLAKEEANISFDQPAQLVHRAIMGMNPFPIAKCQLTGKALRIFKSRFVARHTEAPPGTVIDISDGEIVVACKQGCVALVEVQLENRNRLTSREFLKGHPIPNGLILGAQT